MADTNSKGLEHMGRFLDGIDKWSLLVLEDVSKDRVKEIFQDCVSVGATGQNTLRVSGSHAERLAMKVRTAIIDSTPKYVRLELTEALDENKFDEKFQVLHNIGEKYKSQTEKAWRPPYNANDHMRTSRVKITEAQLKQLHLLISIKKQTIAGLKDKVRALSDALTKIPDLAHQIEEDLESTRNKSAALIQSVVSHNHQLCSRTVV